MTTVRLATAADLSALKALNLGLFTEDAGTRDPYVDQEWARANNGTYFQELLDDGERNVVWVADDEAQPVGYLVARLQDGNTMRPVTSAVLESLYVQADRRNGGFGAALVEHFLAWARQAGAARAVVHVYSANAAAIRFYERFGMRPRSTMLDLALTAGQTADAHQSASGPSTSRT